MTRTRIGDYIPAGTNITEVYGYGPDDLNGLKARNCEDKMNAMLSLPPGRELDALVEEKIFGVQYRLAHFMSVGGRPATPCGNSDGVPPPYSTDIAAAWTVVEHLRTSRPVYCSDFTLGVEYDGTYNAVFFDNSEDYKIPDLTVESNEGPAHAICLAALAAIKAVGA